jgi:hypothetical protein
LHRLDLVIAIELRLLLWHALTGTATLGGVVKKRSWRSTCISIAAEFFLRPAILGSESYQRSFNGSLLTLLNRGKKPSEILLA